MALFLTTMAGCDAPDDDVLEIGKVSTERPLLPSAAFGDSVRIADTPETRESGIAGLTGSVLGETTPSSTNVKVIGNLDDDFALHVYIEGIENELWLAPDLVEFVDHRPGQTMSLDGIDKEWVRAESGEWIEHDLSSKDRPWWKFW